MSDCTMGDFLATTLKTEQLLKILALFLLWLSGEISSQAASEVRHQAMRSVVSCTTMYGII